MLLFKAFPSRSKQTECDDDGGSKDRVKYRRDDDDQHGYGHFPPFVALAAVKNAYNEDSSDVCEWFDYNTSGSSKWWCWWCCLERGQPRTTTIVCTFDPTVKISHAIIYP